MNRAALVTGASRGIGLEIAREGRDLVLVARGEDRLREHGEAFSGKHGVDVRVEPLDLSRPGAPEDLRDRLRADGVRVETLVNNAGFGLHGRFDENDWSRERDMIQLNVTALVELTKYFLPPMVERDGGSVMNVASTAAFFPGPNMAIYYASKSFVVSFTESLAHELRDTGVRVSVLCPGPTDTEFFERSRLGEAGFTDRVPVLADSREVAEFGVEQLKRDRTVAVQGWTNRWMVYLGRFLPRRWLATAVSWLQPGGGTKGT